MTSSQESKRKQKTLKRVSWKFFPLEAAPCLHFKPAKIPWDRMICCPFESWNVVLLVAISSNMETSRYIIACLVILIPLSLTHSSRPTYSSMMMEGREGGQKEGTTRNNFCNETWCWWKKKHNYYGHTGIHFVIGSCCIFFVISRVTL